MRRSFFWIPAVAGIVALWATVGFFRGPAGRVGDETSSGVIIPVGKPIQPVGKTVSLAYRPTQIAVSRDSSAAFVLDNEGLSVYDLPGLSLRQRLKIEGGGSMCGLALSPDQMWVAVSNAQDTVLIAQIKNENLIWAKKLLLPAQKGQGAPYPCGIAWSADDRSVFVCGSRINRLVQLDVESGHVVKSIPVDPAPFSVTLTSSDIAYVTCWSQPVKPGDETADASGTPVPVDSRGIISGASVDRVDLGSGKVESMPVERQPANVEMAGQRLVTPSANGDCLEISEVNGPFQKFDLQPRFGAMCSPTWATYDAARHELAVTLGRSNLLAIFDARPKTPTLKKVVKTAWYPSCAAVTPGGWLVSCAEGFGSRHSVNGPNRRQVYDFEGTLSLVPFDSKDSKVPPLEQNLQARSDATPVPVPERMGEPSVFHHVIYVLKENRTYDQVLGDMVEGEGSAALCDYPNKVTPNQHRLAQDFVLLDNYYCNGILSADGHAWAMEGNATSYFERTFGGWTRSYPYGDDPLSVSSTGFIWNDVLAHGHTFRNYGEFDYATPKPDDGWLANYRDYQSGKHAHVFNQKIGVRSLRTYTRSGYPGWNLEIPDQVRAELFLKDLTDGVPLADFTILYLPQDHTSGDGANAPTPRSMVADNDLALGKVIDGLSHSKYWKDTVVFANEDDPQAGYDHIDGHRSVCFVVSPYTIRHRVLSRFYNQTSVLRTMERILGIPPMSEVDAEAPLMTACFTQTPDFKPYAFMPNQVPLDEMNPGSGHELALSKPDLVDENQFNRILWKTAHPSAPYPKWAAGYRGPNQGVLNQRGLALAPKRGNGSPDGD